MTALAGEAGQSRQSARNAGFGRPRTYMARHFELGTRHIVCRVESSIQSVMKIKMYDLPRSRLHRDAFDVYIGRPGKTNQNQGLTTEAAVAGFSVQVSELNAACERA